jgi:hypothetical protein
MLTVVCGVAILLAGGWFVPLQMKRIHNRLVERGKDPAPFDARVEGATFRAARALAVAAGVIAIAVGLYGLVSA